MVSSRDQSPSTTVVTLKSAAPDFTLDTSGVVESAFTDGTPQVRLYWSDLDAFTQGYVEALFAEFAAQRTYPDAFYKAHGMRHARFSDLSPEALAMILADCAAFQSTYGEWTEKGGSGFWQGRSTGSFAPMWPSLTVSLGDDGKVKLEADSEASSRQTPGGDQ